MDLDFVKSFLTPERLVNDVRRITMCGDVGDPIYCRDYIEIYQYIKQVNPKIHIFTITNGSNRNTAWWEQLASVANEYDSINFSVDGYDNASNNLYRIGSNWDSIVNGMQTLRNNNHKIFMNWAMIIFKFNQDHINNITEFARKLEFDQLQLTKSTKFGSKYGEAYQGETDPLEPRAEWISASDRYERQTITLSQRQQPNTEYLEHNKKMFQLVKSKYIDKPVVPLCEIGNRGIYVNAEGVVFPCSWTSFPYHSLSNGDKTIQWKDSFFAKYRNQMNLRSRTLEEIVTDPLWNMCSQGWSDASKTWVECAQKCSTQLVDENYAVGWETN
jgi:MoaA/NifB/PqqE/SkfB family radical SAM enzyme